MNWLYYTRKTVLKMTQEQLAEEIGATQVTISRGERAENADVLPKSSFVNMQELVADRVGVLLPPLWYFKRPCESEIKSVFHDTNLPDRAASVTGKDGESFPASDASGSASGSASGDGQEAAQ